MIPVLLLCWLPAPEPCPAVADAYRFGVCWRQAVLNRDATRRHEDKVVARLADDCRFTWSCRQEQVWYAWNALSAALNEEAPLALRARCLRELRGRIGDDAFWRGEMPCPIPCYPAAVRPID